MECASCPRACVFSRVTLCSSHIRKTWIPVLGSHMTPNCPLWWMWTWALVCLYVPGDWLATSPGWDRLQLSCNPQRKWMNGISNEATCGILSCAFIPFNSLTIAAGDVCICKTSLKDTVNPHLFLRAFGENWFDCMRKKRESDQWR